MMAAVPDTDFRERLNSEIDAWQREGLITREQADAILARYQMRRASARLLRLGPVTTFVSIVGAIVLGVGVVLFFAANWDVLPAWFKVALVFTGTAAAYLAGYWLQFVTRALPRVGAGLILLGAILFQAGIFLLEQIYNMPLDSPIALLLGAVGILPLAYVVGSRLVLVLGLLDGLAWLGWELGKRYPDTPERYAVPLMYVLAGVLVYAAGHLHQAWRGPRRFAPAYEVLGLLTILLPAYYLSFGGVWQDIQEEDLASFSVPLWFAGAVLLSLCAAAALAAVPREREPAGEAGAMRDPAALVEAAVFGAIVLAVALVAYVPQGAGGYALLFNAIFFGLTVLACVRGYLEGEARFVNTGIPLLALGLITRYIDWFWDLLPRSAFWIAGGVVLLAVAAGLERLRQRLLSGPTATGGGAAAEGRP